jgi:hypothetical protein
MIKLLALILLMTATAAFAQDIVIDQSFPSISRKTGGASYVIPVREASKSLVLTLEAVLASRTSSHKVRIHSVKLQTVTGQLVSAQGLVDLTNSAKKLTVNLSSSELITAILIQAESYAAVQRLEAFVEGTRFVDEEEIARRAEEEARRRAEEEARRTEEERRRAEFQRQQECSARIMPTQRDLQRCEREVQAALRDLNQSQRQNEQQRYQIERLEAPILACGEEGRKLEQTLASLTERKDEHRRAFEAQRTQVGQVLQQHTAALTFGTQWECVMSDVGHRSFWRHGNGRYVGRGETPARALEAAMKTCPNSEENGCGKNDDLKAKIDCRPLN